jgi:hypothetical protein
MIVVAMVSFRNVERLEGEADISPGTAAKLHVARLLGRFPSPESQGGDGARS